MKSIEEKYEKLESCIRDLGSLAVAFSGGVDSTLLMKVASMVLGEKAVAITAKSISFPEREHKESEDFCRDNGIKQIIVEVDQMKIEGFSQNPPNRCYLCKKRIFSGIMEAAGKLGITNVAEGSNTDDDGDYRPGMIAIKEMGVLSPLKVAELSKEEIRVLSKKLDLPTWSKPSFACLATRFVYGETITPEKIKMAGDAEELLLSLGFSQSRCRVHGDIARIEVPEEEIAKFLDNDIRKKVESELKKSGFSYVSLDLTGYRTGSMNEVLDISDMMLYKK